MTRITALPRLCAILVLTLAFAVQVSGTTLAQETEPPPDNAATTAAGDDVTPSPTTETEAVPTETETPPTPEPTVSDPTEETTAPEDVDPMDSSPTESAPGEETETTDPEPSAPAAPEEATPTEVVLATEEPPAPSPTAGEPSEDDGEPATPAAPPSPDEGAPVGSAEDQPEIAGASCDPQFRTVTRIVTVFYGTIQPADGGSSLDVLALSDHLNSTLADAITIDGGPDPRVIAGLDDWVDDTVGAIEWTLTASEGLDPETTLREKFIAFAASTGGVVASNTPVDLGLNEYELAEVTSFEDDTPGCGPITVTTTYTAELTFHEVNATVETPEPATLRFRVLDQDGHPIGNVCFNLTGELGGFSSCTRFNGTFTVPVFFDGEPVTGLYTLTPTRGPIHCAPPELPDVQVDVDDFSTTIDLGDFVFTCEEGSFDDCMRTITVSRAVTIYYGTIRGTDGEAIQDGLALSDHISSTIQTGIENSDADPRVKSGLGDWINEQNSIEWVHGTPDGLDAQAALVEVYTEAANPHSISLDPAIVREADFLLSELDDLEDGEFCSDGNRLITTLIIAAVSFVELNATVNPDVPCSEDLVVTRDVYLYYGTLRDADGAPVLDGRSLSDHISAGLRIQIANSDVDARARTGLDEWQSDLTSTEWVLREPEDQDAKAGLLAIYADAVGDGNITTAAKHDRGTFDFVLQTITDRCGHGTGEGTTEFVGRVHFIELNASIDAESANDDDDDENPSDTLGGTKLPVTGIGSAAPASSTPIAALLGTLPILLVIACGLRRRQV